PRARGTGGPRGRRSGRSPRTDAFAASRAGSLSCGLVPRAADGSDQLGPAELAPELRDVDVDRPRPAVVRHPPNAVEQLLAREHDPVVLDEPREEVELLRGQVDGLAPDLHLARVAPELDVADAEGLLGRPRLRPAENRLDPRCELAR